MVSEKAMAELRGLSAGWRDAASGWLELDSGGDNANVLTICADELEVALDKLSSARALEQPEGRVGGEAGGGWIMALAKEIRANAEDHPNDYISRFALDWADELACRAITTPPPPAKVPEGMVLSERDKSVMRFALHRFMGDAYAKHGEASQKTEARRYAPGAAERFYQDAKDAERLLSMLAAAQQPKEGA